MHNSKNPVKPEKITNSKADAPTNAINTTAESKKTKEPVANNPKTNKSTPDKNTNNAKSAMALWFIGIIILFMIGIASFAGFHFYQQINSLHEEQQLNNTTVQNLQQELHNKTTQLNADLLAQAETTQALKSLLAIQEKALTSVSDRLSIMTESNLFLIKLVNLVEQANKLWQQDFNRKQVLRLLKQARDVAKKTKLKQDDKFIIVLSQDISTLEMLYPANRNTSIRYLNTLKKQFNDMLDGTDNLIAFANPATINSSATVAATSNVTVDASGSMTSKLSALLNKLFVVRQKQAKDTLALNPQSTLLFKQLINAKLEQAKLAILHNSFSVANSLLLETKTSFHKYAEFNSLQTPMESIINVVAQLNIRANIKLRSLDYINTLAIIYDDQGLTKNANSSTTDATLQIDNNK